MRSVPRVLQGPYTAAVRLSMQEAAQQDCDQVWLSRVWKLFLLGRMLLWRPPRAGLVPKRHLGSRLSLFVASWKQHPCISRASSQSEDDSVLLAELANSLAQTDIPIDIVRAHGRHHRIPETRQIEIELAEVGWAKIEIGRSRIDLHTNTQPHKIKIKNENYFQLQILIQLQQFWTTIIIIIIIVILLLFML